MTIVRPGSEMVIDSRGRKNCSNYSQIVNGPGEMGLMTIVRPGSEVVSGQSPPNVPHPITRLQRLKRLPINIKTLKYLYFELLKIDFNMIYEFISLKILVLVSGKLACVVC